MCIFVPNTNTCKNKEQNQQKKRTQKGVYTNNYKNHEKHQIAALYKLIVIVNCRCELLSNKNSKIVGGKIQERHVFLFVFLNIFWCCFSFLLVILFQENVQHCINFRHYCKLFLHTVGPCSKRSMYAGTWETLITFLYAKLGPDGGSLGTTPGAKGWIALIKYENGTALMFQFLLMCFFKSTNPQLHPHHLLL